MPKIINKIIQTLIYSDLVLNVGWGLLSPVFAIFILEKITIGNVAEAAKVAGFASMVYWFVKSSLQIPIGRYLDKNHGEKDDLWSMIIGSFVASISPFIFMVSSEPWHIYVAQVIHAIGMAMLIPSWSAIFTRHIDKGEEAFEWSVRSTSLGFGVGISAAIGGVAVSMFGFNIIFMLVGILTVISGIIFFLIHKNVAPEDEILSKIWRINMPF